MSKNKSLQKELTVNLILVIAIFYLFATSVSFFYAYREAQEFQDDVLRQIARYSGDTSNIPISNEVSKLSDDESAIFVFHLPHDKLPTWLNLPLTLGFQDISSPLGKMRVYVNDDAEGRDVVAQLTEGRDEIAINSAFRALVPLLFLLPLIAFLIARLVKKEFKFINKKAAKLDEQTSSNIQEISLESLPSEITPFIAAINRLITRIKILLDFKSRFIANAAHELRTPLTSLSIDIENLANIKTIDELRNRLLPVLNSIQRTTHLTNQLLSYSKLEAKDPKNETFDLNIVCRQVLSDLYGFSEARGIEIECKFNSEKNQILNDRESIEIILRNVLENAIKYSPENSSILIEVKKENSRHLIQVTDNGPGIPMEFRKEVLEPFRRLNHGDIPGTGLGLAIAHEAAKSIGAELIMADREDEKRGLALSIRI